MEFRILGPLEALNGTQVIDLRGTREQVILAMLLLDVDRVVPVDRLIDAIWDETPPRTARTQVYICISTLRRRLAAAGWPNVIASQSPGYIIRRGPWRLDADAFEEAIAQAREERQAGRLAEAADRLRAGLALWRGHALAGVPSRLVQAAAVRLRERQLHAIEEWAVLGLQLGAHDALLGPLFAAVAEHPFRERLHEHLMLALYRAGRQAEALEVFRGLRRRLVDELGLEPSQALRELERAILDKSPSLDAPPITVPGRVTAGPPAPRQLPADIADFTGRQELADAVLRHLARPSDTEPPWALPIVAFSGKAGVGKTALAVHVAHRLQRHFPDGQFYVDLRASKDQPVPARQALRRFLRALGVADAERLDNLDELTELYRTRLADRRVLVVLDDAASAEHVSPLLPGSPSCAVVVVARHRLPGLCGARQFEVDVLEADTAVDLLAEVAGPDRIRREPDAARRLAMLCGGLPLALRIAGTRLAVRPHWSVAGLVDRMRDERRRLDELVCGALSVRASLSSMYCGLAESAKVLFRRLGLIDATDVAARTAATLLDTSMEEATDLLECLVEAQLLDPVAREVAEEPRYGFHSLIRVFAKERALAEDPLSVRSRVLAHAFAG